MGESRGRWCPFTLMHKLIFNLVWIIILNSVREADGHLVSPVQIFDEFFKAIGSANDFEILTSPSMFFKQFKEKFM